MYNQYNDNFFLSEYFHPFNSPFPFYSEFSDENNQFGSIFKDYLSPDIKEINNGEFLENKQIPDKINENITKNDLEISTKNTKILSKKTKGKELSLEENKITKECQIEVKNIKNENIHNKKNNLKQGRKKLNEKNKGIHTKDKNDNKLRKIKTSFGNYFHNFLNNIIIDPNLKLTKIDKYINEELRKEFNIKLLDTTFKKIYKYKNLFNKYKKLNEKNKNIINKIYKENKEKEDIKILNLTYGEVFDIFISDLKPISLELEDKIIGTDILNNEKFLRINNFLEKIREQEKNKVENEVFIDKYISSMKNLCVDFKEYYHNLKGRNSKNRIKYIYD